MYEEPLKWYEKRWPLIIASVLAGLSLLLVFTEIPNLARGVWFDAVLGIFRTLLYVVVVVIFFRLRRKGLREKVQPEKSHPVKKAKEL